MCDGLLDHVNNTGHLLDPSPAARDFDARPANFNGTHGFHLPSMHAQPTYTRLLMTPVIPPRVTDRRWLLHVCAIEMVLTLSLNFSYSQVSHVFAPGWLFQDYRCHLAFGLGNQWLETAHVNLRVSEEVRVECTSLLDLLPPDDPRETFAQSMCRVMAHRMNAFATLYILHVREVL